MATLKPRGFVHPDARPRSFRAKKHTHTHTRAREEAIPMVLPEQAPPVEGTGGPTKPPRQGPDHPLVRAPSLAGGGEREASPLLRCVCACSKQTRKGGRQMEELGPFFRFSEQTGRRQTHTFRLRAFVCWLPPNHAELFRKEDEHPRGRRGEGAVSRGRWCGSPSRVSPLRERLENELSCSFLKSVDSSHHQMYVF